MSNDYTADLFFGTVDDIIREQIANGLTEDELKAKFNNENVANAYLELINQMAEDSISSLLLQAEERVHLERQRAIHFERHNEQIWHDGFIASEMMYIIATESAQNYRKIFEDWSEEKQRQIHYKYLALLQLHGRACQQYLEVLCLLKSGFADGAFARWRSMYELCIVAYFISKNDETVAKAFYDDSFLADAKEYNWAKKAPCFSGRKGKVTFRDILNQCKDVTEKWEKQYGLSNKIVHATAQGTFARLGKPQDVDIIAIGPSDYGLAMPAVNAAIVLAIISSIFFTMLHSGDGGLYTKVTTLWVDKIREIYTTIERESFSSSNIDTSANAAE